MNCTTRSAFSVVFGTMRFPFTVVTPMRSMASDFIASIMAMASSEPGSQSRITFFGIIAEYLLEENRGIFWGKV